MDLQALGTVLTLAAIVVAVAVALLGALWYAPRFAILLAAADALYVVLFAWNPDLVGGELACCAVAAGGGAAFVVAGAFAVLIGFSARPGVVGKRRWNAFARDGAVVATLLVGAWLGTRFLVAGLTPGARLEAFDPAKWSADRAPDDARVSDRARMLHDLVHRVLPGRSRTEILEVLGAPDAERPAERAVWYSVSPTADEFLGATYLEIVFDESGRFLSVRIQSD